MKKNQAILILIAIFVVSAALGIGCTWAVKKLFAKQNDKPVSPYGGRGNDTISVPHDETIIKPDTIIVPPVTYKDITLESVNGPIPNPETYTYSFTANASGGLGQLTYYLYPTRNAQDTLVSISGSFANVAPISGGKYVLLIKDRTGQEFTKEIRGFTAILNKLTTQQLTTRLSKSTPDQGLGKHFASGYKIKFSGIQNGDPIPTSYTQIYSYIASGYWSKVNITAVEFNDYNKITKITVSVYYN